MYLWLFSFLYFKLSSHCPPCSSCRPVEVLRDFVDIGNKLSDLFRTFFFKEVANNIIKSFYLGLMLITHYFYSSSMMQRVAVAYVKGRLPLFHLIQDMTYFSITLRGKNTEEDFLENELHLFLCFWTDIHNFKISKEYIKVLKIIHQTELLYMVQL